ncbi:MAG TPA: fused MFS/spermidine synthase [Vicinamibacterales bacterium]|jgi:spermidine synthase|nr:fused MFS/spermidine synthase [Vicinamibacterales bacterium]
MASRRQAFVILYAASGAAALVYEITWTRLLTLVMGHTVAAASTVLAAFMGGLAAGSWLGGRLETHLAAASDVAAAASDVAGALRLRLYATLELVIAASAIFLPLLLAAFTPVLTWAYQDGQAPMRFGVVRVMLSIAALGVPTMAMGATFPIAASWFSGAAAALRRKSERPSPDSGGAADAGALYAANTAGAAVGALAAGLWLIPAVGVRATTWIGAALNVSAALGAVLLARAAPPAAEPLARGKNESGSRVRRGHAKKAPDLGFTPRRRPVVACAATAICGFVALVYEIAWTRLLVMVVGPTTYAFTIVVASFIIGIALGSAAGARVARRSPQPALWLGAMLMVTSVAASAAGWFVASRLPLLVAAEVANPDAAFGRIIVRQALVIFALLLPIACALGAAFPLALATAGVARPTIGRDLARVYASNTLGAIAGALVAGFVLLPSFGLRATFRMTASLGLGAALAVWVIAGRFERPARGRLAAAAAFALGCAAVLLLPPWDLSLLASGAYKYAPYLRPADLETELRTWRLLSYKDGAAATVSVRELAGMRSLVIDGKVDASNMGDMLTQRLLGLLPVLLHPNPRDVCVIGLGSGVTAGSALATGTVRRADLVEVSPEVVTASTFFDRENGGVLGRPGVRLIVGDGRSHLRLTKQRYDVIVSEPSNPWMAGIAALFTREFFQEARSCLKPDGLVCQWAHTYDMRAGDLQSIVRTFTSVFPESTMWLVGDGDLLLIGSNGGAIDLGSIERHWRQGRAPELLREVGVDDRAAPFALLSLLAGGPAQLQRYSDEAPIQHDDRMALEFSAPLAIYGRAITDNAAAIRQLADPQTLGPVALAALHQATDVSWTVAGAMELKADAYVVAYDRFERAIRLNSRNPEALAGLSDAAAGASRQDKARALLESIARAEPDNAKVRIELSRLLAAAGETETAAAEAKEAMRLAPDDPDAAEQLASVFADAGDAGRLAPVADALASRFPLRDKSSYYQATKLVLQGHAEQAIDEVRSVAARNPQDSHTQNLLGVACANAGLRDCALAAFNAAAAANPRDPATYVNLGVFYLQAANPAAAAANFSIALTLDRSSVPAKQGLGEAQAALAEVK